MQEAKKSIKDMAWEEHLEYNRQFIRKLREDKVYQQHEKEYSAKYYEENTEKIRATGKEQITCTCGCVLTKNTLSRHKKSQKHLNSHNEKSTKPSHES